MNNRKEKAMPVAGIHQILKAVPVAVIALAAGCGSPGDEPEATEMTESVDVDPYESVPSEDPPRLDDAPAAQDGVRIPASPDGEITGSVEDSIYAEAGIEAASGSAVSGSLRLHQQGDSTRITGKLHGLEPGQHGLHVHEIGDCSAPDAGSAKGHFAPDNDAHGAPDSPENRHHVGDLGNIVANEEGTAVVNKTDTEMTLETGKYTVIGRAVIVHAQADDLRSQPSGAAGARVGCGVIEPDVAAAYKGA
jgi:Cu-Zn family superoxide dismutase